MKFDSTTEQRVYTVPGMSCEHCRAAISEELAQVPGAVEVQVDLDDKRVTVSGSHLDDRAIRGAIEEAGYEVQA